MKTRTEKIFFHGVEKVTCTTSGEKSYGKEIWINDKGEWFELMFAKLAKTWAFVPMDKEVYKYYKERQNAVKEEV